MENAELRTGAGAPVWECCVRSRFLFMAIVASLETSRKEIIVSVGGGLEGAAWQGTARSVVLFFDLNSSREAGRAIYI